jgi:hypothetical protein
MSSLENVLSCLRPWRVALAALVVLAFSTVGAAVAQEKRVALVIGNGAYTGVPYLPNPPRDAEAVAKAFKRIGFDRVISANNLTRDELLSTLRNFAALADGADWAVVYYAGHGMEIAGTNYALPVDAKLTTDRDVAFEAIPLTQFLTAVEGARKLRLIFVDACRDNPFLAKIRRTGATRSIGRGLARIEPPGGTLVAYAARDGEVAHDGDNGNSPFVSSLLQRIETPGLELNKLFRLVRNDVMVATANSQEPFVYGSLPPDDFFFVPPKPVTVAAAPPPAPARPSAATPMTPAAPMTAPLSGPISMGALPLNLGQVDKPAPAPAPSQALAALPPPAPSPAEPLTRSTSDIVIDLKKEMKRLGCYEGAINPEWPTSETRKASERLKRYASIDVKQPDQDLLSRLGGFGDRTCPLECSVREVASGDRCVLKQCPSGATLNPSGQCVRPQAKTEAPVVRERAAAPRAPEKPASGGGGARCFSFGGQRYCE